MARVWSELNNGEVKIISYTPEHLEGCLEVLRQSFFLLESVCIGSEINLPANKQARDELEKLCKITAEDGVSLIAKKGDRVVGVAFNKIQMRPKENETSFFEVFMENDCRSPSAKCLMQFMIDVDGKCNLFDDYKIDHSLEIMFLATMPDCHGQRIGRSLCEQSIELAREFKKDNTSKWQPQICSAIFTSIFSQKIGLTLKFDQLIEVSYTDFTFNGYTFASRIGPMHPSSILVAKRI